MATTASISRRRSFRNGARAQALDTLERARAEQDAGMVILLVDPFLDPLRADPRFVALLKALHFS